MRRIHLRSTSDIISINVLLLKDRFTRARVTQIDNISLKRQKKETYNGLVQVTTSKHIEEGNGK